MWKAGENFSRMQNGESRTGAGKTVELYEKIGPTEPEVGTTVW